MTPKQEAALRQALETFERMGHKDSIFAGEFNGEITAIREALAEPEEKYQYGTPLLDAMTGKAEQPAQQQPASPIELMAQWTGNLPCPNCGFVQHDCKCGQPAQQQEPIAKVCHDLEGHIGWNPKLTQLPDEGTHLYTSTQLAQQKPVCPFDAAHDALEKAAGIHISQQTEQQQEPVAETMRQMLEVQGQHGNWNYDSYMHGLYNGMEYMVALAEKREPHFRDAPETWLAKYEAKRDNFNNTQPLTESTSQPSKPWVRLTNDEIALLNADYPHPQGFARALEAKLREKNA